MRNVTEIQQRLIALGFPVGPNGADGRFGTETLAAYNRYLASKGKPPHRGLVLLAEVNAELFPEEQPPPKPKPIRKPGLFDVLALVLTLSKGNPMSWETLQQLVRIALYAGGSFFFGQSIADGALYQGAIGGVLAVGAFVWWAITERAKAK